MDDNLDVCPVSPIETSVSSRMGSQLLHSDRSSTISQTTTSPGKEKSDLDTVETRTPDYNTSILDQSHPAAVLRCWLPELLASGLSIVSLMSTVIVLWIYDGRGASDLGLPYSLTLNGLIAALATLNRAFLMVPVGSALSQEAWLWLASRKQDAHCRSRLKDLDASDQASRGAWGSLLFLFQLRFRYLAILGAVISILSLGFGTFTQQLISLEALPINDPGSPLSTGNLPHSEAYQSFVAGLYEKGDLDMKAAIVNGILTSKVDVLSAKCPTGNCTWPTTPSVAVCGDCVPSTYNTTQDSTWANFTMSSGSVISLAGPDGNSSSWQSVFAVVSGNGSHFKRSDLETLYVANFDVFGTPYNLTKAYFDASLPMSTLPWDKESTIVTECALWACVQSYDVSTRSGQQMQTISSNYSKVLPIDVWLPSGNKWTFATAPVSNGTSQNQDSYNFTFAVDAENALRMYLQQTLTGKILLSTEADFTLGQLYAGSPYPSDSVIQAIWQATPDLKKWINNLAISMTNAVRSNVPASRENLRGTAYQLGVRVRWEWLALPIAMIVSSIVLLVIVIIKTAGSSVQPWKSSPLVFLFCDVDPEIRNSVAGRTGRHLGMEKGIGKRKAVLTEDSDGTWTFRTPAFKNDPIVLLK